MHFGEMVKFVVKVPDTGFLPSAVVEFTNDVLRTPWPLHHGFFHSHIYCVSICNTIYTPVISA